MHRDRGGCYHATVIGRDVPDFGFPNPAGAGAGAGFQNLVQRKTTPELQ